MAWTTRVAVMGITLRPIPTVAPQIAHPIKPCTIWLMCLPKVGIPLLASSPGSVSSVRSSPSPPNAPVQRRREAPAAATGCSAARPLVGDVSSSVTRATVVELKRGPTVHHRDHLVRGSPHRHGPGRAWRQDLR